MKLTLITWCLEDYKIDKHHFHLIAPSEIPPANIEAFALIQANLFHCVYLPSVIRKAYEQRKTITL